MFYTTPGRTSSSFVTLFNHIIYMELVPRNCGCPHLSKWLSDSFARFESVMPLPYTNGPFAIHRSSLSNAFTIHQRTFRHTPLQPPQRLYHTPTDLSPYLGTPTDLVLPSQSSIYSFAHTIY